MSAARLYLATAVPGAGGVLPSAAAVAIALASLTSKKDERGGAAMVVETGSERPRRPTLLASPPARRVESRLRAAGIAGVASRGTLGWLAGEDPPVDEALAALAAAAIDADVIVAMDALAWRGSLDAAPVALAGVLVRANRRDRHVCSLLAADLRERGLRHAISTRAPGHVAARRALAGLDPGGETARRAARIATRLRGGARERPPMRAGSEQGQALPLMLGAAFVVIATAVVAVALGAATSAANRVQRAADLAALSGARSLRDDRPRLFEPARLPDGRGNPRRLTRAASLGRARRAAIENATRGGVRADRLRISFPGSRVVPGRITVAVRAGFDPRAVGVGDGPGERIPIRAKATAEALVGVSPAPAGPPASATGDGYSGPLAYRQGKPMRPDVARAFDDLVAAASRAGLALTINSAYRSDAEQAALFAAHPDPRWVAPPGTSLHRCGTELDLGPAAVYGWLDANAPRFGFSRRYAWEAWHFGYDAGPAPCSAPDEAAGRDVGSRGDGSLLSRQGGLPAFVPARFREPISRAATRWNVSAGLLAAQLMVESGFDPGAVSPAGALGIAQFMPATAAAYGLRDPFDAKAAIAAQARLMAANLRQFGSPELALAAYNAGSGAVAACNCVPSYPETQAYVARILGLLGAAGETESPQLEVRLVA